MVGWHHQLNGHESEQTPGDSKEQGSLVCCGPLESQRVGHDLVTEQQQLPQFPIFLDQDTGRKNPSEATSTWSSLNQRAKVGKMRKQQQLELAEKITRVERELQRERCRVLHRFSLQSATACIHVKKLPAIRERATERIRGNNLQQIHRISDSTGLSWWLRQSRICLQYKRLRQKGMTTNSSILV